MSGEDWYVLAQQGEWIFLGLLAGEFLEYCATLCTLFRLLAAPAPNKQSLKAKADLVIRFEYLHKRVMSPPCMPLQFLRLHHGVESVQEFGTVFIYWCFRGERLMGRLVKMLRRSVDIEAHLAALIRRVVLGRVMCGLVGPAEEALARFVLSAAADSALRNADALETKRKLIMSGAPLRVRGWRKLQEDEKKLFTEHLQQAGNVDVCLVGKRCREFVEFVLHGRRFTCAQGLNAQRSKDVSGLFVLLKTGECCRVDKGLELDLQGSDSLKVLAVVPYKVLNNGHLGVKPVVLENLPVGRGNFKWVKFTDITTPVVTVLKPQRDTADFDQPRRIALPALAL
eukprot:g65370.t1